MNMIPTYMSALDPSSEDENCLKSLESHISPAMLSPSVCSQPRGTFSNHPCSIQERDYDKPLLYFKLF